ncbi:MAG: hypothetical protein NXH74_11350 [Rhodobacteraceae bacterium]|nr:hypothetical protein [Paracoccaceae bacterium]
MDKQKRHQTREDLTQAAEIIEQRRYELSLYNDPSVKEDLLVLKLVLDRIEYATETLTHQTNGGFATHMPRRGEGHHGNITRTSYRNQGS